MDIKYVVNSLDEPADMNMAYADSSFSTKSKVFTPSIAQYIINEYYCNYELGEGDVRYFMFWDENNNEILGKFKAEGYSAVNVERL